jgi:lipid A disaccharide synthetase
LIQTSHFKVSEAHAWLQQGMTILRGLDKLAFMGFSEVVKNLGTVLQNFSIAKKAILADRPDALLLIDYPGFNLRLAKWAKKQGIPVSLLHRSAGVGLEGIAGQGHAEGY